MKQTPIHDKANHDLMELIPHDVTRIVDVGCMAGSLAREYKKVNSNCEFIGIDIDPDYAELARKHFDRVVVGDIERIDDETFASLFPSDCWFFADVLEHLYDPWSVLRRIRTSIAAEGSVLACIPNAQHWAVQSLLNAGTFRYADFGLLDRTHIRWFTRLTIGELFEACGFRIASLSGRIFEQPEGEMALLGIQAFAEALGNDPDQAVQDAIPYQWLVRAMPK